jgi:hypothetical protein
MALAIKAVVMVAVVIAATVIAIFAVVTANMLPANSAELTASDKATEFLSSVVGLDLAKYTLTKPPSDASRYRSELCGLVKEEWRSFKFEANGSTISIMSGFYNGQMKTIKISTLGGDYIYSEQPATDLLNQAKDILQRYQTYATQVYATDNAYLVPMQNILNRVSDLSPANLLLET